MIIWYSLYLFLSVILAMYQFIEDDVNLDNASVYIHNRYFKYEHLETWLKQ
jgi:hypothetical protein